MSEFVMFRLFRGVKLQIVHFCLFFSLTYNFYDFFVRFIKSPSGPEEMHYTFIHHLHGQQSKRNHFQRGYIQQYMTDMTFSPNQDRSIKIWNPYGLYENVYGFRSLICHNNTNNKWLKLTKPQKSRQVWSQKWVMWSYIYLHVPQWNKPPLCGSTSSEQDT